MVRFGEDKMAKSVGNVRQLSAELDRWGRDALIMYFCAGHYRQPIAYSDAELEQAQASVGRVREAARRLRPGASPEDLEPLRDRFFDALAEDFNTPAALAALFDWVREANKRDGVGDAHLREMLGVLGLENLLEAEAATAADDETRELARRREEARARGDYAEADRLRDELRARGWEVRDSAAGPELIALDAP